MKYTKYFITTQEETVDMQTTVDERMMYPACLLLS